MSLVSTNWLYKNLNNVKIIDCSWHLPNQNRDSYNEFLKNHIPNSIFFDLDKYSDLTSDLPHMLPDFKTWEKNISSLGIKNNDRIAQIILSPVIKMKLEETENLPETIRGEGGFGSTGK